MREHAFSNLDRAQTDERVRGGISSMQSSQFGHGRVSMQQSRIDAGSFRQASLMTGANPVSPSRGSFNSTDRQVNPGSIPNRSASNQHFFSNHEMTNRAVTPGRSASNFNGGGNQPGNTNRGSVSGPSQHGFTSPSSPQGRSIESSRPGWRSFTPPSGQSAQPNGDRTFEGQNGNQPRTNSSQPAAPPQNNSRGRFSGNASSRPTLSMQQPVVAPRGGNSYPGRGPTNGSYSPRPMPSAPGPGGYSGGSHGAPSGASHAAPPTGGPRGGSSGGGSRGGNSGGGSHGGSSGGGHSHR